MHAFIYLEHLVPLLKLDIKILSILHYLRSPLGFCTLIFALMRNLYIYNKCIYIHSIHAILITASDGSAGGQACQRGYSLERLIFLYVYDKRVTQ